MLLLTRVMQHLAIVFAACIRVMCSQGDVFGSGKLHFVVSLLMLNLFWYEGHVQTLVTRMERKNVNLSSLMNLSGVNLNQDFCTYYWRTMN